MHFALLGATGDQPIQQTHNSALPAKRQKDKKNKQDIETKGNEQKQELNKVIKDNENIDEAISALQDLGYSRKEIEKAFEKTSLDGLSVEDMIRRGLSLLGK